MLGGMGLLLFYLFLAIGVSFLCSILEAALLSITPTYIAAAEQKGQRKGALLRQLKEDINRPLSAILTLNTIAHTVGAAGVGAQAQIVFGKASVSLVSAVLTFLILVLSEIIPKTLGASHWRALAGFTAQSANLLIVLTYPLVVLCQKITDWLSAEESRPAVSAEEFRAMARVGAEEGIFEKGESNILQNLFKLRSLRIKDIMTPRPVVIKHSENAAISEVLEKRNQLRVSRIPIYENDEEEIAGYVLKTDLYHAAANGEGHRRLKEFKRKPLILPEAISIRTLFERLLESREHIAVVVDEYGGFAGVATVEDVIETLLGIEITDEADAVEDMRKLARERWERRARKLGLDPGATPPPPP